MVPSAPGAASPRAARAARLDSATLALLVLLGAAMRLAFLFQPMRLDETASYTLLASRPLATLLRSYPEANNHPLHTLLVHLFTACFGSAPWSIRAPAFVAGVLVVPAAYRMLEELYDRWTGLLGAALCAASSPLVEYSTNARGYTIQTVCVLVVFLAAAKILRGAHRGWWVTLATAAILGFYTIPTMAFFFGAALVWMLASAAAHDADVGAGRMAVRLAGLGAAVAVAVGLLYLPFVLGSGLQSVISNRWVRPLPWAEFGSGLGASLGRDLATWHRGLPLGVASVLVASFATSLVVNRQVSRFKVSPVVVATLCALAMTTAQRVLPPERVWLPLVPFYLGASAAGLRWMASRIGALGKERLGWRPGPIVGAALVVLVGGATSASVLASSAPYQAPDQVTFRDAEPITEILAGILRDDDVVYVHSDARFVLDYYFTRHHLPTSRLYRRGQVLRSIGRAFAIDSSAEYPKFTFAEALNASNLARTKDYEVVVIARLPHATILQVRDPELARESP